MKDCSLCGGTLQPEGGAILFTDNRGVPFEVCSKCEGNVDVLRNPKEDAEVKAALDYISGCAENLEYRDTYDNLMGFIKDEEPAVALPEETDETEEDEEQEGNDEPEGNDAAVMPEVSEGNEKTSYLPLVVVIAVAGILILAYALGGFRIG